MPTKSESRLICESYCKLKRYKSWADMTLARKAFEENRDSFKNVEQVRSLIRTIRGHIGVNARKKTADKDEFKPITNDTRNWKPFKDEINTSAKILILDIETAPVKAFVWGLWKQNVGINQITNDWFMLTWAAKWLFEDKVYSGKLTPKEAIKQDDKRICKGIWQLLNEADIVIAHNGQSFDIPKLNARFIINGMQPTLPYLQIDTLLHIRKQFGFSSNKLDYVNKLLNLERKEETGGFELWSKCYEGNQEALDKMEFYNIGDVRILEETYLRIRAYIKPHPNLGLHILNEDKPVCPTCGSNDLKEQGKLYHTTASTFDIFRCNNCGATGRKRLSNVTLKQKRNLLLSIPK